MDNVYLFLFLIFITESWWITIYCVQHFWHREFKFLVPNSCYFYTDVNIYSLSYQLPILHLLKRVLLSPSTCTYPVWQLLLSPVDRPAPVLTSPPLELLFVRRWGSGVAAVEGMSPPTNAEHSTITSHCISSLIIFRFLQLQVKATCESKSLFLGDKQVLLLPGYHVQNISSAYQHA